MGRIADYYKREPLAYLVTVLGLIGLAAVTAGLIYSTVTASSLPSFFPGHTAGLHRTRGERGHTGVVIGVFVLLITAVVATDLGKHR